MNDDTGFRPCLAKPIEQIGAVEIAVGIPRDNNGATIVNVIKQISRALGKRRLVCHSTLAERRLPERKTALDSQAIVVKSSASSRHGRRP